MEEKSFKLPQFMNNKLILPYLLNIFFPLVILISGCQTSPPGINLETKAESAEKLSPEYANLTLQPYSDYVIVSVGFDGKNRSPKFSSSYYGKPFLVTNLIFYHKFQDTYHSLLQKSAIITQFKYLLPPKSVNQLQGNTNNQFAEQKLQDLELIPEYLFYKIIDQDTNEDGELNSRDAILGYISDLNGKNLQLITPESTQIESWEFFPEQELVLLKIKQNSYQDPKLFFDEHDQVLGYFYNLNTKESKLITPTNIQLLAWQVDKPNDLIFLKIKKDSNGDGKFTSEDQNNFLKIKISDLSQQKEMFSESK